MPLAFRRRGGVAAEGCCWTGLRGEHPRLSFLGSGVELAQFAPALPDTKETPKNVLEGEVADWPAGRRASLPFLGLVPLPLPIFVFLGNLVPNTGVPSPHWRPPSGPGLNLNPRRGMSQGGPRQGLSTCPSGVARVSLFGAGSLPLAPPD